MYIVIDTGGRENSLDIGESSHNRTKVGAGVGVVGGGGGLSDHRGSPSNRAELIQINDFKTLLTSFGRFKIGLILRALDLDFWSTLFSPDEIRPQRHLGA